MLFVCNKNNQNVRIGEMPSQYGIDMLAMPAEQQKIVYTMVYLFQHLRSSCVRHYSTSLDMTRDMML